GVLQPLSDDGGGVRATSEERRVTEGGQAGGADQQIEREREDGEDEHVAQDRRGVPGRLPVGAPHRERDERGRRHDRDEEGEGAPHRAMRTRPRSPVGRSNRMKAMIAKMSASANCGNSTFPKVSAGPTRPAPASAPESVPSPPTTTTMREERSASTSMPGKIPKTGAAM